MSEQHQAKGEVPPDVMAGLRRAAAKFREYEWLHMAKNSPDGEAKASANRLEAELLESLIAAHEPEPVDPLREVVDISLRLHCPVDGRWTSGMIDALTAELRARGVTVKGAGE